jgi:hypothetical protein
MEISSTMLLRRPRSPPARRPMRSPSMSSVLAESVNRRSCNRRREVSLCTFSLFESSQRAVMTFAAARRAAACACGIRTAVALDRGWQTPVPSVTELGRCWACSLDGGCPGYGPGTVQGCRLSAPSRTDPPEPFDETSSLVRLSSVCSESKRVARTAAASRGINPSLLKP